LNDLNANSKTLGYLTAFAAGSITASTIAAAINLLSHIIVPDAMQMYEKDRKAAQKRFNLNAKDELEHGSRLKRKHSIPVASN